MTWRCLKIQQFMDQCLSKFEVKIWQTTKTEIKLFSKSNASEEVVETNFLGPFK